MKKLRIIDLGTIDYDSAMEVMLSAKEMVKHGEDDTLLILEHTPVITIGTDDEDDDSIVDKDYIKKHNIKVVKTDRGGGAVIHNNGQIVCYPILKLCTMPINLISDIVSIMYDVVSEFDIKPKRGKEPGLWVNDKKIGFIGMKIHEGISMHGFAINICNDTQLFKTIKTCGVQDENVTNLSHITKTLISLDMVKNLIVSKFARKFSYLPDKFIITQRSE